MEPRRLLERSLDALRDQGAQGDGFLEHRQNLSLNVRDGKLDSVTRAEVRGLGIRAMVDGRLGFVHTSQLDDEGVVAAAREACALARAASPRDDLILAPAAGPGDGRDEGEALGIHDASIAGRALDDKQEWVRAAERAARELDPRIRRTESAGYDENLSRYWIAGSSGLFRHYTASALNVGIEVTAEEGEDKQPGTRNVSVVRWADLPDPAAFGREAAERGLRLLGGRPVATGRYPVVFSREVGWTLLVYLNTALNGDALATKRSWLTDRAGERIGSERITIVDDGRRSGGVASAPFDGEGVDTGRHTLLERGVVSGALLDLSSARRLDQPSTGNSGRGGYSNLPVITPWNVHLEPGKMSVEELLAPIETGLWIWGMSGWWIGLDPSNSQFSSGVNGLWIEKGEPTRPVARITVAGSIQEILGSVDAVASDLIWEGQSATPTFRVSEMAVSGT